MSRDDEDPPLEPGTPVAGRYTVVKLLGEGSTKRVYLAWDRLASLQVALCLLRRERRGDPTLAARFSREARAAAALRSPFVVQVYDVGKLADGTRYMVTEAVLGRGLDEAMRYGAVEPDRAARWAMQVLEALAEAHARGVLHRDVKPENVLLAPGTDSDPQEVARLTDFGLAKVLDGALEGSQALRTAQGVVMGTPDYMAPEQWQGLGLDGRADLYSVGAMLFEMLLGRPPFPAPSLMLSFQRHLRETIPEFPRDAGALALALEPVVRRALAKRPAERYPDAHAMLEALAHATGLAAPSPSLAPPEHPERFCRAELVSDAWPGVVQLVAAPRVVLGREGAVRAQCLPHSPENLARSATVSRRHASLEWRGGRALLRDLGSRTGTRSEERDVTRDGAHLDHGQELRLGPHVRFVFEHAPCPIGALPPWARLTRTDPYGARQAHVLVLTEALLTADPASALPLPAERAGAEGLTIRNVGGALMVLTHRAAQPEPLRDGQLLRVGSVQLSVALTSVSE
ncbi:MAG: protein kinase [Deltaproteobacteria bacterium]|nr:protein kinase [Deltaproteobacteria bacterium]